MDALFACGGFPYEDTTSNRAVRTIAALTTTARHNILAIRAEGNRKYPARMGNTGDFAASGNIQHVCCASRAKLTTPVTSSGSNIFTIRTKHKSSRNNSSLRDLSDI